MKRIWEGTAFGCQVSIELDAGKLRVFRIDGAPHEIPSYADVIIRHAFVGMAQEIEALRRMPKDGNAGVEAFLADVEARLRKATPGPIDVHRIDNHDGSISYQLQQSGAAPRAKTDHDAIGARVLTQYDDLDNPDARHDAEFSAYARADIPRLVAIVREQNARVQTVDADDVCVTLCSTCSRSIVGIDQGLAACPWCERDALRDRLAKLEAATSNSDTPCHCQLEAGDSPCPMHGENSP